MRSRTARPAASLAMPPRGRAGFAGAAACRAALPIDNRAAPARDDLVVEAGPPGLEPGPARLELAVLPFTPQAYRERTTRIEQASPEWRPGALPSGLRPPRYARLESNQRPLPS